MLPADKQTDRYAHIPVADLHSKILDARLPLGPIFFIFINFSGKFGQIIGWHQHWNWRPSLANPSLDVPNNNRSKHENVEDAFRVSSFFSPVRPVLTYLLRRSIPSPRHCRFHRTMDYLCVCGYIQLHQLHHDPSSSTTLCVKPLRLLLHSSTLVRNVRLRLLSHCLIRIVILCIKT